MPLFIMNYKIQILNFSKLHFHRTRLHGKELFFLQNLLLLLPLAIVTFKNLQIVKWVSKTNMCEYSLKYWMCFMQNEYDDDNDK